MPFVNEAAAFEAGIRHQFQVCVGIKDLDFFSFPGQVDVFCFYT